MQSAQPFHNDLYPSTSSVHGSRSRSDSRRHRNEREVSVALPGMQAMMQDSSSSTSLQPNLKSLRSNFAATTPRKRDVKAKMKAESDYSEEENTHE